MATQTVSISNSLYVFGPTPTIYGSTFTSGYNVGKWGTDSWGEGSIDQSVGITKLIQNTQSLSDVYSKVFRRTFAETLSVVEDLTSERKGDGSGFFHEFTSPSDNAEDRAFTQWTEV